MAKYLAFFLTWREKCLIDEAYEATRRLYPMKGEPRDVI